MSTGFPEDFRYAARQFARSPAWRLMAVLVLGLGVGANTTIFTTIRAIIFAPIAAVTTDRSVVLLSLNEKQGVDRAGSTLADFLDWRRLSTSFETLTAFEGRTFTVTGAGEAERLQGVSVSPGCFEVINAAMGIGRMLRADESEPGQAPVLVLSDAFWRRRFAADPAVLGRSIQLDGVAYTVVGVAGAKVWFPSTSTQFWTPLILDLSGDRGSRRSLDVLGKLKPGVSLDRANQELTAIAGRLVQERPATNAGWSVRAVEPYDGLIDDNDRLAVFLSFAVAACVLLIACSNVANLLLVRALAREREIAVRLALGASRWRLIRLHLAESLLLAVPAAALGVLLSAWTAELIVYSFNFQAQLPDSLVDARVTGFALLAALGSALLFSLAPAWHAARQQLSIPLREGGARSAGSPGRRRLARSLVTVQVALALALVTFSGLIIRSMLALHHQSPGYQTRNMITIGVRAAPWKHRTEAQFRAYFEEMLRALGAAPGVEAIAGFSVVPTVGGDGEPTTFAIEGRPTPPAGERPSTHLLTVTPGAFETLRLPILRGRGFTLADTDSKPRVVVVSQGMARQFWRGGEALGHRIRIEAAGEDRFTIVGVTRDVTPVVRLRSPRPQVYVAWTQRPVRELTLVARTGADPAAVLPDLQRTLRALDPEQPARFDTIEEENYRDLRGGRAFTGILIALGLLAVVLCGVGLFGLLAHSVRQRLPEIGLRAALGATRADVLKLVFGFGLRVAGAGFALGLAAALALGRLASSLLLDVSPADPLTFLSASALLALVVLLACYGPARFAARTDPATVLRNE